MESILNLGILRNMNSVTQSSLMQNGSVTARNRGKHNLNVFYLPYSVTILNVSFCGALGHFIREIWQFFRKPRAPRAHVRYYVPGSMAY